MFVAISINRYQQEPKELIYHEDTKTKKHEFFYFSCFRSFGLS